MVELEIAEDFLEVFVPDLPGKWKDAPAPASAKDFGSTLLKCVSHIAIKIPSTVITEEYNYIINPRHPLISDCKIARVTDFVSDIRIKSGLF